MNYEEFAQALKVKFGAYTPKETAVAFNVLDEMHANENAHTRILASLIRIPEIGRSFVEYVAKKRPDLAGDILPFSTEDFSVDCQTDCVDLRIEYGSKLIIVENKVKGAVDQNEQIDRYVMRGRETHQPMDIFVIYLTKDGTKQIADYSFNKAKKDLNYVDANNQGHFILIDYAHHIVDWLENHVKFSVA